MDINTYNFPVELQPLYTNSGLLMTDRKGVVRTDTQEVICSVSNKYNLIKHSVVVDAANAYVSTIGTPDARFFSSKKGAVVSGEYTYFDKTVALKRGDVVGLRVHVGNSYNASSSIQFRIGAMVMACMNGMMIPKQIVGFSYRHDKDVEIIFPDPAEVLEGFYGQSKIWNQFQDIYLGQDDMTVYSQKAIDDGIVTQASLEAPINRNTVWDLYNKFTYHITHNEKVESSYVGKLSRLNKLATWFEDMFIKEVA